MQVKIVTSTLNDGNMSYKIGSKEEVDANRHSFFEKNGIRPGRVVTMAQVHGDRVGVVKRSQIRRNTDGLITKAPNLWLTVYHADCIPLFFIDETIPAIGIAHVGWKGLVAGLPVKMVKEMVKHFKSKPERIKIKFGPYICANCYNIEPKEERVKFLPHKIKNGQAYLDFGKAVIDQLTSAGVLTFNILTSNVDCTVEQPEKYWSHHKLRDQRAGGMISAIGFS